MRVRVGGHDEFAKIGDHPDRRPGPHARPADASTICSATACRPAPRATASSSAATTSRSSAAATPRSRKRTSSPSSPTRSRSFTGARSCGHRRSCRTAPSRTRRSSSSGTATVTDVKGDGRVEALQLRDTETGAESELEVTGLFVAIGHDPNTKLFVDKLELDAGGYIVTQARIDGNVDSRGLRRRRRAGPPLPAGDHRGRFRMYGGARVRALPRSPRRRIRRRRVEKGVPRV